MSDSPTGTPHEALTQLHRLCAATVYQAHTTDNQHDLPRVVQLSLAEVHDHAIKAQYHVEIALSYLGTASDEVQP